ncbi:MAG TPA: aquaporin [candidate division Zixibacteria bacterium]|nr:aquaporin [candidate division Zixibacteria bacterium]
MVMAIILFMGNVSGAHLNPAVSISFAARGDFPWRRVPRLHYSPANRIQSSVPVPMVDIRKGRNVRSHRAGHRPR